MTIECAKKTKKEYAEKPFSLWDFRGNGKQFTIEEDLQVSQLPRTGKKEGVSKHGGTPYSMEIAKIRISDGIFEKDLHLSENEWTKLSAAIPDTLLNLKGVVMAYDRDNLTYVGVSSESMNENMPRRSQDAPGQTNAPSTNQSDLARQLSHAIELNFKMGIKTDQATLQKIADAINPGKGLDLIVAAKTEGWVYEKDGIFRGE